MTADNGAYVKPGVEARRLVADANLIAVGCSVWSRSRVDAFGDPVGGLVCRISHWDKADEDTGEIEHRITYITRFPAGDLLAYHLLDAADVDPSAVELVNRNRATKIVRRICKALDRTKKGGITPPLTASELAAIADAYRLVVEVGL